MPETKPRQNSGAAPAGVENTALQPAEDKRLDPVPAVTDTAAPAETAKVKMIHHYDFEGEALVPGREVTLPVALANTLTRAKWAQPAK